MQYGDRDVAQLVHELEEVEGWGATARFVRVRQMKKKVKKAKSTAQDFQNRLHVRTQYGSDLLCI